MSIKSKNKRVGLCLMVGTICIVVAGLWAVLATPETALAKKPSGGGGGGGNDPACFELDFDGGGVWSDGLGDYCNNKKGKVEAIMNSNGGATLRTNTASHRDPYAGRTFFVDFGGAGIDLIGNPGAGSIQKTNELPDGFINKSETFRLPGVDAGSGVDLRAMAVHETSHEANLVIGVSLLYPDGETGAILTIIYWPENQLWGCDGTNSTHVTVTRTGATTWDITNRDADGNLSQAILHERLITPGGGSIDDWCRPEILTLPPFTVTVTLQ